VSDSNVIKLAQPGAFTDSLTEILRSGARALLTQAVEAEVAEFLAKHTDLKTETGLVSRAWPVQTAMRNCTRDEGGPFEVGNQVLTSSHRKLLSSKAMVVNVAETSGHDPGRHD